MNKLIIVILISSFYSSTSYGEANERPTLRPGKLLTKSPSNPPEKSKKSPMYYQKGNAYLTGRGAEQNVRLAIHWFEKAAANEADISEQLRIEAMYKLGTIYDYGIGYTVQDKLKAKNWYTKAAHLNHGRAQYRLGVFYSDLVQYRENIDIEKALYWLKKSSDQGVESATRYLHDLELAIANNQLELEGYFSVLNQIKSGRTITRQDIRFGNNVRGTIVLTMEPFEQTKEYCRYRALKVGFPLKAIPDETDLEEYFIVLDDTLKKQKYCNALVSPSRAIAVDTEMESAKILALANLYPASLIKPYEKYITQKNSHQPNSNKNPFDYYPIITSIQKKRSFSLQNLFDKNAPNNDYDYYSLSVRSRNGCSNLSLHFVEENNKVVIKEVINSVC